MIEPSNHTIQMMLASQQRNEDCLIFPTPVSLKLQRYICYQAALHLMIKSDSSNGACKRISWNDMDELESIVVTSHQLYKSTVYEIAPKRNIERMMVLYPTLLKAFNEKLSNGTEEMETQTGFQFNCTASCIPAIINLGENVEYDPVYPEDRHGGQTHDFSFKLSKSKKFFTLLSVKGRVEETLMADSYYAIIYNYPEGVLKILFKSTELGPNIKELIGKTVELNIKIVIDGQSRIISLIESVNGIKTDDGGGNTLSLDILRERKVSKLSSEKEAREMMKMRDLPENVTNKADQKTLEGKKANKMTDDKKTKKQKDNGKTSLKAVNVSVQENDEINSASKAVKKSANEKGVENQRTSSSNCKKVPEKRQVDHSNQPSSFEWKTSTGNHIKQIETDLATVDWNEISRKNIKNGDDADTDDAENDEVEIMVRGKIRVKKGVQLLALNDMAVNLLTITSANNS